jgi:hypothetical protein
MGFDYYLDGGCRLMDITQVLTKRFPDAEWTLNGDSYSGLTWLSAGKKPTLKALEAEWAQVEYEIACERVEADRQVAYRLSADPIFFEFQRGDKTEVEWLDAVQAVKDANPYPVDPATIEPEIVEVVEDGA